MYAAIRRYRVVPDSKDELIRNIKESFVPIIRESPELVAYYVLDISDGMVATISIFENQAGVARSNRLAARWIQQNMAELLPESVYSAPLGIEEILQGAIYGGTPESLGTQDSQEVQTLSPREASELPDSKSLQLLSVDQLSEVLGMGKSWVYRQIRSGEIPSIKLGRAIKVKRSDLEVYLKDLSSRPPDK